MPCDDLKTKMDSSQWCCQWLYATRMFLKNHSKLSWQLFLPLSKSHKTFEGLGVCWCLPRPQNGCVVSLITKQDTWLKKKLSVFPLQVISSAHGHLFIASLISLFPKPKPQMKPKIQAGTTQKAKEGNNMSFLRPIPTPIFDTTMLTIPWSPTKRRIFKLFSTWKIWLFSINFSRKS